jgi:gluconokinase
MFIIVFGVTGAGKTTIGQLLAEKMSWNFYDADDFHPITNIDKMKKGIPLADEDRTPWLASLQALIKTSIETGQAGVMACSALRDSYRTYLKVSQDVRFIYLRGEFSLIRQRLESRTGHYMNPALLQSQFDILEEPQHGELVVSVDQSPEQIVAEIRRELGI